MSNIVTIIPVRMKATRLPNKPLLDVNGKTVLQRVCENVKNTITTDYYVATPDIEIFDACKKYNTPVILTEGNFSSGTDRICYALKKIDPNQSKYDVVVNFQGDGINVNPQVNIPLIEMLKNKNCDIATCGMIFKDKKSAENPTNVKIVMGLKEGEKEGRCLYFTRSVCPYTRNPEKIKNKDLYHHIGIYVYTAYALKKFVSLPTGILEERESLEQLRALENGMTIMARIITESEMKFNIDAPADINTIEELELARKFIF